MCSQQVTTLSIFISNVTFCFAWKNSGRFKRYKGTFQPHTTTGLTDEIIQRGCDVHADAHSSSEGGIPTLEPEVPGMEQHWIFTSKLPTQCHPSEL